MGSVTSPRAPEHHRWRLYFHDPDIETKFVSYFDKKQYDKLAFYSVSMSIVFLAFTLVYHHLDLTIQAGVWLWAAFTHSFSYGILVGFPQFLKARRLQIYLFLWHSTTLSLILLLTDSNQEDEIFYVIQSFVIPIAAIPVINKFLGMRLHCFTGLLSIVFIAAVVNTCAIIEHRLHHPFTTEAKIWYLLTLGVVSIFALCQHWMDERASRVTFAAYLRLERYHEYRAEVSEMVSTMQSTQELYHLEYETMKSRDQLLNVEVKRRGKVEQNLRETLLRFHTLLNNLSLAVFMEDLNGKCIFVNNAALQLFGIKKSDLVIGHERFYDPMRVVYDIRFENHSIQLEKMKELAKRDVISKDEPVTLSNGSLVHRDYIPILHQGKVKGHVWTYRNMDTLTILAEERARAEAANAAKSMLVNNMSHELRTPLNSILGIAEICLMTPSLSEEMHEYLTTLMGAANELVDFVNDIFDFSRLDASVYQLELSNINLRKILFNVARKFYVRAMPKKIPIFCSFGQDLPLYYLSDAKQIECAISHLVDNAVKFTHHGHVEIGVTLFKSCDPQTLTELQLTSSISTPNSPIVNQFQHIRAEKGANKPVDHTCIWVRDTGLGISRKNQKNLFNAFRQGDETYSRRFGGIGLGLAIVFEVVKLLEGHIRVVSRLGEGATFYLFLPLHASIEPISHDTKQFNSLPSMIELAPLRMMRVLVVEENSEIRKSMGQMMTELGCEVTMLSSSYELLSLFSQEANDPKQSPENSEFTVAYESDVNSYDVMFIDQHLPVMDASEVLSVLDMKSHIYPRNSLQLNTKKRSPSTLDRSLLGGRGSSPEEMSSEETEDFTPRAHTPLPEEIAQRQQQSLLGSLLPENVPPRSAKRSLPTSHATKIVLLAGFRSTRDDMVAKALQDDGYVDEILPKPFDIVDIAELLVKLAPASTTASISKSNRSSISYSDHSILTKSRQSSIASLHSPMVRHGNSLRSRLAPLTKSGKPLRALVVEDVVSNQVLFSRFLSMMHVNITIVVDGIECVDYFESDDTFDIILMDIQMPRLNGIDAAKRIREIEQERQDAQLPSDAIAFQKASSSSTGGEFHPIPIIAVSAHVLTTDTSMCLEAGMNAFLPKPVVFETLYQTLASFADPIPEMKSYQGLAHEPHRSDHEEH